jgi:hypothetical protein
MDKNLFHFLKDRKIFTRSGNHTIRHYSDAKEFHMENNIVAGRKNIVKKAKKKY